MTSIWRHSQAVSVWGRSFSETLELKIKCLHSSKFETNSQLMLSVSRLISLTQKTLNKIDVQPVNWPSRNAKRCIANRHSRRPAYASTYIVSVVFRSFLLTYGVTHKYSYYFNIADLRVLKRWRKSRWRYSFFSYSVFNLVKWAPAYCRYYYFKGTAHWCTYFIVYFAHFFSSLSSLTY